MSPAARFGDFFGMPVRGGFWCEAHLEQVAVARNYSQRIVEVVRHTPSQLTYGFHFLRLAELIFQQLTSRDIGVHPLVSHHDAVFHDGPHVGGNPHRAAIFAVDLTFQILHHSLSSQFFELFAPLRVDIYLLVDIGNALDQLLRRVIAQHLCHGRIDLEIPPFWSALKNPHNRALEN